MKKSNTVIALISISLLLLHCSPKKQEPTTNTIPFVLTDHNNIAVNGIFNDLDTVNLMFHTAANDVSLTIAAAEKTKSVLWNEEVEEVESWGGKGQQRISQHNSLSISNLRWDSLLIWENRNSGPTTDGKFGPNLFEDNFIEIDFDKKSLSIHEDAPEKIKHLEKIPISYENGHMFIELTCEIGGQKISNHFLIHSGYSGAMLFDDNFAKEHEIASKIEITDTQDLKDAMGNTVRTSKGNLSKVWFGNKTFENITVGFFEGTIGRQQMSVIGGELLKRFNLIIDPQRTYLYIAPNKLNELIFSNK